MPVPRVFTPFEVGQCAWRSAGLMFLVGVTVVVGTVIQNFQDAPSAPSVAAAPPDIDQETAQDSLGATTPPPEAPPEAQSFAQVSLGLQGGLTEDVRKFANSLYIGTTVWEIPSAGAPMSTWRVVFVNSAASPMLQKDMEACVGHTVLECFPELDNDAGRRYGELAELSLSTRRLIHVGATQFAQSSGSLRVYYNAISYVDDHHVAVLYHVLSEGRRSAHGEFSLGLQLSKQQSLDVQIRVLSDVAAAIDKKLDTIEEGTTP